jgi:hypothetical protein
MQRILVLGAGFAGLWSAVAAPRRLEELGAGHFDVEVLGVNRAAWHSIHMEPFLIFVFAAWNGYQRGSGAGYDLLADAKYFLERLPGRFIEMRNKGKT